jgi:hypothetical protein
VGQNLNLDVNEGPTDFDLTNRANVANPGSNTA